MIAALFALAATMIVAGVVAVIEGFPYVRLESGMAMVYGGSVVGSSGVLLLGLAVVSLGLRRIEGALKAGRAEEGSVVAEASDDRHDHLGSPFGMPAPAEEAPLFVAPPFAPAERSRIEPSLLLRPEPDAVAHAFPREPELPLPGLTPPQPRREEAEPKPEAVEAHAGEPDLFVPPPPPVNEPAAPEAAPEPAVLRPSLDAAPEPDPQPAMPVPSERTVVGRYSSGGNTYVMFDDGSIEADTPNGRFNFASLDELKAFVDSGGETGTRGAA